MRWSMVEPTLLPQQSRWPRWNLFRAYDEVEEAFLPSPTLSPYSRASAHSWTQNSLVIGLQSMDLAFWVVASPRSHALFPPSFLALVLVASRPSSCEDCTA